MIIVLITFKEWTGGRSCGALYLILVNMLKGLESILSEDKQSLLLYFLLGGLAKHLVAEWQARKMKKKVLVGKVSRILLHPVKSLGGIDIQEAEVTRIGLKDAGGIFDRSVAIMRIIP